MNKDLRELQIDEAMVSNSSHVPEFTKLVQQHLEDKV